MNIKIRPIHDRVVVYRLNKDEETTSGGIVIPDTAKEKPSRAKVVAVGEGKPLDNGQVRPLQIKVGDEVLFGKYAGTEAKLDDKEYLILREEDILGVVEA